MREFMPEKRPAQAVVVGAGYIGIEAADALRRNGLRVTVLDRSPQFAVAERRRLIGRCANNSMSMAWN